MCPRPFILSAYFDGELDRRKYARLEVHLRNCAACQTAFNNLLRLRETLREEIPVDFGSGARGFRHYALRSNFSRIGRGVSIPVPVAVAAFIMLFGTAVLNFLPRPLTSAFLQVVESPELETDKNPDSNLISVSVSSSELEGILAIMEREISQSGQLAAVLPRLAEDMQFTRNGEPQFLRPVVYGDDP